MLLPEYPEEVRIAAKAAGFSDLLQRHPAKFDPFGGHG